MCEKYKNSIYFFFFQMTEIFSQLFGFVATRYSYFESADTCNTHTYTHTHLCGVIIISLYLLIFIPGIIRQPKSRSVPFRRKRCNAVTNASHFQPFGQAYSHKPSQTYICIAEGLFPLTCLNFSRFGTGSCHFFSISKLCVCDGDGAMSRSPTQ